MSDSRFFHHIQYLRKFSTLIYFLFCVFHHRDSWVSVFSHRWNSYGKTDHYLCEILNEKNFLIMKYEFVFRWLSFYRNQYINYGLLRLKKSKLMGKLKLQKISNNCELWIQKIMNIITYGVYVVIPYILNYF